MVKQFNWLQEQLQIIGRRLEQLRESWAQTQLRLMNGADKSV